jgi:hypothetical protein
MKFEAKWTTPVIWAEIQFKFWHWMFVLSHHTLPRASFHLKTQQEYFFYDQESFDMLKTGFGGTCFSTLFGTPFAENFQGK